MLIMGYQGFVEQYSILRVKEKWREGNRGAAESAESLLKIGKQAWYR